MKFTLKTNDAIYNAGILGLVRIFDKYGITYESAGGGLSVDDTAFENFTEHYLNALIDMLGGDMPFKRLEESYVELKNFRAPIDEAMSKKLGDIKKALVHKMDGNSYKAGYEIIKKRGESFDFAAAAIKIKKSGSDEELLHEMLIVLDKMKEYRDVFLLKDIAYSQIQYFWSSVAFLNKQENVSDFCDAYNKTFYAPFTEYLAALNESRKRKTSTSCCQCYAEITGNESSSISWVNNQSVDIARKTNVFWNFKSDLVVCPLCAIVYSCVPLGFKTKGSESYFINQNASVEKMKKMNNDPFEDNEKSGYYKIIRHFLSEENGETAENEINNIQVLKRSGNVFYRNILSKDKLNAIRKSSRELKKLVDADIQYLDNWHNLFDEVIGRIFAYENLWNLMYTVFTDGIKNNRGYNLGFISTLHKIQNNVYGKGDAKMSEQIIQSAFTSGKRLRVRMIGADRNENKVTALSFRLLNALKCKNDKMYLEALMRQYLSEGTTMPNDLCEMLSSEENFLNYGYSFLSGLNAYTYGDKNKEEQSND